MRHPLTMEPRPPLRPGLPHANLERTCQDQVMTEDIQDRRARAQTRALNQETVAGLIGAIGPCDGGRIFHALLAAQEVGGGPTKFPDCLVKEVESKLTSHSAACSSKHSGVWTEEMEAEFDGLLINAARIFAENSEVPEGSNIVDSKWLLKWKGGEHGMIDRAKARLVAKGYAR